MMYTVKCCMCWQPRINITVSLLVCWWREVLTAVFFTDSREGRRNGGSAPKLKRCLLQKIKAR